MKKIKFILIILFCLSINNNSYSRIVDTIEALEKKSFGNEDAKIKMLEFASLTCGHCAKFHKQLSANSAQFED